MLVLSRQRDETIMIGDEIEITVVDIRGDKVRLGITAPTKIAVHRKEVYEAIKAENQKAAQINGSDLPTLRDDASRNGAMRPRIPGLTASAKLKPGPLPLNPPKPQNTPLSHPHGGAQTA